MEHTHETHHARPLDAGEIGTLHTEVTAGRHPHGPEAELMCNCFRAVSGESLQEARGIEGNPERIEALRALWKHAFEARQLPEA